MRECAHQYGSVFSLKVGPSSIIVLCDREAIHKLLIEKGSVYSDRPPSYVGRLLTRGDHLALEQMDSTWRDKRKVISLSFSPKRLDEQHLRVQEAEATVLMKNLLGTPEGFYNHVHSLGGGRVFAFNHFATYKIYFLPFFSFPTASHLPTHNISHRSIEMPSSDKDSSDNQTGSVDLSPSRLGYPIEAAMRATSASGGDGGEQDVGPINTDNPPQNPAELSRDSQPSIGSDELTDYERRMEEYDRRHQARMDQYFGLPPNDDDDEEDDDSACSLDSFTKKLISPETDVTDERSKGPEDPTPLSPKIQTNEEYMDDYISTDWQQTYAIDTCIELVQHRPANPYGYADYPTPANVNPSDWGYGDRLMARARSEHALHHRPTPYTSMTEKQRRDDGLPAPFKVDYSEYPTKPQGSITLQLLKPLSGSSWSGPAVFLCLVKEGGRAFDMPPLVVAKFQDPMFFDAIPPPDQPFFNEFDRANINLSREAGAYEKLAAKGCHGHTCTDRFSRDWRRFTHIAPRYYGTFAAKVKTYNPALIGENPFLTRSVGVILMEYLIGYSISSLCDRGDPGGALTPRHLAAPPSAPSASGLLNLGFDGLLDVRLDGRLDMSLNGRLDIVKTFMDGYVRQLFVGVYQEEAIRPEHILVAPVKYGRVRVAMIHYRDSLVDCKCKKPQKTYDELPDPPHPYTVFKNNMFLLSGLAGWFPCEWMDKDNKDFEAWLITTFDNDEFGPYFPRRIGPAPEPSPTQEAGVTSPRELARSIFGSIRRPRRNRPTE
ncbi:hypothetical protein CcaCcLH18_09663 [Colletotrichum camelliae]|nr:hypothetical protein CcaCcLH18_09663 [Colletotrichum camelliae]